MGLVVLVRVDGVLRNLIQVVLRYDQAEIVLLEIDEIYHFHRDCWKKMMHVYRSPCFWIGYFR